MPISQRDFDNAVKKFSKEEAKAGFWGMARSLLENGYEIEAYVLILATWNFAGFRYLLKDFNLNKFKKTIRDTNPIFKRLEKETFKNADFNDKKLQKFIKMIYKKFKEVAKQTGATKIMALKKPDLFVMWDTEIRKMYNKKYKVGNGRIPDDYIKFLNGMKKEFWGIKWHDKHKPLAKAVDEYNYVLVEKKESNKRSEI